MDNVEYDYIAIEGNIGSGKTTLSKMLAQDYNCELILEQFTDNPFLPYFYKDPKRYGFPVEIFFLTERYKQLQEKLLHPDMFIDFYLSDYFFRKTAIFAKANLNPDEYRIFLKLYESFQESFPRPDILVYLHRDIDNLYDNIQLRNRAIERDLEKAYLIKVQNAYFDYFQTEIDIPIVMIDITNIDFQNNFEHYKLIKQFIFKNYKKGLNRVVLS